MLKIVFMGTPSFSVPILEALIKEYDVALVVTQPDKEVGRKREVVASPVKKCALEHNIPVFQPQNIRKDYQPIIDANPDLIVTAAFGQIIGTKILNYPKYRSINVHASLLPKYRGGAPIHYSVINGDKETGVTIMYMEKAMDAGDILSQRAIPILEEDTTGTMFEKLSLVGRDLLMETIPALIKGEITPIKQNEDEVTYAYNITAEQETLDLNEEAKVLINKIRGLLPAPGANMVIKGDTIKVYQAKVSELTHNASVGTIIGKTKKYFSVACGNSTAIDIYELQVSGKRRMMAADFINGGLAKYM
ncbi:MAG: methionyl-tRNA formyltransferase [Bacilli bacterium]|nr:methionyl-tRNA formyltransferase [Bacilli bacterium]